MKKTNLIAIFTLVLALAGCKEKLKPDTLYVEGSDLTADIAGKTVLDAAVVSDDTYGERLVYTYSVADGNGVTYRFHDGLTEEEQDALFHDPDIYTYAYPPISLYEKPPKLYVSDTGRDFAILGTEKGSDANLLYVNRFGAGNACFINEFSFRNEGTGDYMFQQYSYEGKIEIVQCHTADKDSGRYWTMKELASFVKDLHYSADGNAEYTATNETDFHALEADPPAAPSEPCTVEINGKTYEGFRSHGRRFYWLSARK